MALVITIVIIIILATITINMVFGDNGLVEKAEQAKNMTEEAAQKEQSGLANATAWLNEIIYGEGSGGNTGTNEETPGTNSAETNGTNTNTDANSTDTNSIETNSIDTNSVDTNSIDTNSVDTNTIEPPPVEEIPDGDEEGAIIFGAPTWTAEKANITISTETEYKIEYQINKKDEGSWTELSLSDGAGGTKQGTVTGLNNNDTIYARLTDGTNHGKETSTTIKDSIEPQVTVTPGTITSSTIKVEIETVDNESGMQETVNYTYYIKKSTEGDASYKNSGTNTNANFTFTGLEQGTSYDIKVEVQGDKAGNMGVGILEDQTTKSLPGGETGLEQGAISFGAVTWAGGTASVPVSTNTSFTLEYQVATGEPTDENWKTIANNGSVTGINHNDTIYARLTDGVNYGEYASITIKDTKVPTLSITQDEVTDKSIKVTANAVDNETGLATESTYKFYLNNELKATQTEATYTFDGLTAETPYSIKVEAFDKAGNMVSQTVDITTLENQGMSAVDIASKPMEYYGAEVINYEAPHAGVDKWRIYYADESNIYLIADDYIAVANVPNGQKNSQVEEIDTYQLGLSSVSGDYDKASWINENSKGAKWLSQYLNLYSSSKNANVLSAAYMMDTNVWSAYYAGEGAEYAMGGPTIELLCASYKNTHPTKYIECGNLNTAGYQLKWNDGDWSYGVDGVASDFNEIYREQSGNKALAMWLAGPASTSTGNVLNVGSTGSISTSANYGQHYGLRPIVCMKADTKLELLEDGSFKIIRKPISVKDIVELPAAYYGAEITNYTTPHEGVEKWRIFYADDTNVYLIADDYIAGENAPQGKDGSVIYQNGTYRFRFNEAIKDYEGASWISSNSKGAKWLSQFLSSYGSSKNNNIKNVAYMMDTNVWSAYYAGEDAEYAMGGPTIEMFCASYKDTHPSQYLECGNLNSNGYQIRWNEELWSWTQDGLPADEFNSVYVKSDYSKAGGMWLASPSAYTYSSNEVVNVSYQGNIGNYFGTNISLPGFRAIVCLKDNVQFLRQDDGTLMLVK